MKRVLTLAVVSVLLLGGVYAVYQTTRGKVMAKKAGDAFDELIGKTDVKRERINERVTKLESAVDKLETEQFKTEEEAKTQNRLIKAQEVKVQDAEDALRVVKKHLTEVAETSKPVSISGKDYNQAELDKMAKNIIEKHKKWAGELTTQNETLERQQARASKLKERVTELKTELVSLKQQIKVIDEKAKEVEALKRASSSMGDADKTVGENLDELKKSISDLDSTLNIRLQKEDSHWDKVGKTGDDAEKFIKATKGSPDTLSEIDAILKSKK